MKISRIRIDDITEPIQLDRCLKDGSEIAIKSAIIKVEWKNVSEIENPDGFGDIPGMIPPSMKIYNKLKNDGSPEDINNPITTVSFPSGFYTLKEFINHFNSHSERVVYLTLMPDNQLQLKVAKGYLLMMHKSLAVLIGQEQLDRWNEGEYYGSHKLNQINYVILQCSQLDNHVQLFGTHQPSTDIQLFHIDTIYHYGDNIPFFYNPLQFFPIRNSTSSLDLKLINKNNEDVSDCITCLELIIKEYD